MTQILKPHSVTINHKHIQLKSDLFSYRLSHQNKLVLPIHNLWFLFDYNEEQFISNLIVNYSHDLKTLTYKIKLYNRSIKLKLLNV